MNKTRTIIATTLIMVLGLAFCLTAGASNEATPTLTIEQVTTQAGDTVEVTVSLINNPGFCYIKLRVNYDSTYLTLDKVENGIEEMIFTQGVSLLWDGGEDCTEDTVLATLTFTVSEDAPEGSYPITVICDESYNYDEVDVAWTVVAGKITVEEPETIPTVGETVTGYTLTMQGSEGGDIGVNLKMTLTDELLADNGAYAKVVVKGSTSNIPLSELTYDSASGKYSLTTYTPAKNMSDEITVTVFNGAGENGASYTYSVKSYAEYILEHSGEYEANLVSMVKATLNYGAMAQKYFGYNTEALANSSLSATEGQGAIDAITSIDVADPVYNGTASAVGLAKHSASIVLGSETTIKHYITLAEGQNIASFMFQLGGTTVTPVADGDRYCITISNIEAADLDSGTMFQVICMNPFGMYNVTYSAMNYVEAMFNACKDNAEYADLCNLLKAIYLYNDAANTYFGK